MAIWIKTDGGRDQFVDRLPPTTVYNDCLTRAFALITRINYGKAWVAISQAKRDVPRPSCPGNAFHKSSTVHATRAAELLGMRTLGWIKLNKRRKLSAWVVENPRYTGIVRVGNHFVAVSRRHYYDTYDSGNKQVTHYGVWE